MERAVVFAGFGGQGLLFAGNALAQAAMGCGWQVLWIPSYGPEMRGGTASCQVIVADCAIGSPFVEWLDAAVVLNPPSLGRFEPRIRTGGILIANDSLIEAEASRADIRVVRLPATALAREAGDERLTAVVGLGALAATLLDDDGRPILSLDDVRDGLRDLVEHRHPELLAGNLAALTAGSRAAGDVVVAPVGQG